MKGRTEYSVPVWPGTERMGASIGARNPLEGLSASVVARGVTTVLLWPDGAKKGERSSQRYGLVMSPSISPSPPKGDRSSSNYSLEQQRGGYVYPGMHVLLS